MEKRCHVAAAACILHNICIMQNDMDKFELEMGNVEPILLDMNGRLVYGRHIKDAGELKREYLKWVVNLQF